MESPMVVMWCLYNKKSGQTVEGLTTDEVRAFLMGTPADAHGEWLAWSENLMAWTPVTEVEGLGDQIQRELPSPPPELPEFTKSLRPESSGGSMAPQGFLEVTSSGEEANSSSIPTLSPIVRLESLVEEEADEDGFVVRNFRRFKKRYEITILVDDKSFTTHSADISVGGIHVTDSLPDWVAGYFKVRIKKPSSRQQVELTACLVENQGPTDRVRISFLPLQDQKDEKNLEVWLAA